MSKSEKTLFALIVSQATKQRARKHSIRTKIKPNLQVQEQNIAVNESLSLNGLRLDVGADGKSDRLTILYFGGNLSHADESIKNLAPNGGLLSKYHYF